MGLVHCAIIFSASVAIGDVIDDYCRTFPEQYLKHCSWTYTDNPTTVLLSS